MDDVDLLARPEDLTKIDRLLKKEGWTVKRDGNPVYQDPSEMYFLDIETRIWYARTLKPIWERSRKDVWGGISIRRLGPEGRLIYLVAWSVIHRGYFSEYFGPDLARLLKKDKIDWDRFTGFAGEYGLKIPIHYGLSHLRKTACSCEIEESIFERLKPRRWGDSFLLRVLQRIVTNKKISGLGHPFIFLTAFSKRSWLREKIFPGNEFLWYRYGCRNEWQRFKVRLIRPFALLFQALLLPFRLIVAQIFRR